MECPTYHDSKYITVTCPHCEGQGEVMEECPDCSTKEESGEKGEE